MFLHDEASFSLCMYARKLFPGRMGLVLSGGGRVCLRGGNEALLSDCVRLWGNVTPLNGGGEGKILLVDASTILFLSLVLSGGCYKHFFSFCLLKVESKAY